MMEELPGQASCSKRDLGRSSGLPPGHLGPPGFRAFRGCSLLSEYTDPAPWLLRAPWGLALACRQPLPHSGSLRSSHPGLAGGSIRLGPLLCSPLLPVSSPSSPVCS